MRERVAKRLHGGDAEDVTICTFHALGLKFLQIEHAAVGLKRGFSIFDADDSTSQVKDLMYGAKPDDIEDVKNLISRAKNAGLSPEQAMAEARSNREKEAASVYERYQLRLTAFNAVDFDDLIRLPVQVLEENPEIALARRERIGYLLVDECRDTNDAVPAAHSWPAPPATSPAWATMTSPSTPGAVPTRKTCSRWRAITRRWKSSSWSRTTAAPTACCARPTR